MAKNKPLKIKQLPIKQREPIWDKIKVYIESGLSYGKIIENIEHEFNVIVSSASISDFKNNNDINKGKTEQIKTDIIDYEDKNRTITEQKNRIVNQLSKLTDFEITTLDELIQDETGIKSLLFSTANLSLIRKNQLLTKNTKQVVDYETIYSEDGKPISKSPITLDIELNPLDLKAIDEGIDKNAITLDIAKRHANAPTINNANLTNNETTMQINIIRDN